MLEIKPLSTNKIISCTVPIEINKLQEYFNDKEYRLKLTIIIVLYKEKNFLHICLI
mgnify:CR=1 FL=1